MIYSSLWESWERGSRLLQSTVLHFACFHYKSALSSFSPEHMISACVYQDYRLSLKNTTTSPTEIHPEKDMGIISLSREMNPLSLYPWGHDKPLNFKKFWRVKCREPNKIQTYRGSIQEDKQLILHFPKSNGHWPDNKIDINGHCMMRGCLAFQVFGVKTEFFSWFHWKAVRCHWTGCPIFILLLLLLSTGFLPASSLCPDMSSSITDSSPPALSIDTGRESTTTTSQSHSRSRAKNQANPTKRGARPSNLLSSTRRSPRVAVSALYHPLRHNFSWLLIFTWCLFCSQAADATNRY